MLPFPGPALEPETFPLGLWASPECHFLKDTFLKSLTRVMCFCGSLFLPHSLLHRWFKIYDLHHHWQLKDDICLGACHPWSVWSIFTLSVTTRNISRHHQMSLRGKDSSSTKNHCCNLYVISHVVSFQFIPTSAEFSLSEVPQDITSELSISRMLDIYLLHKNDWEG